MRFVLSCVVVAAVALVASCNIVFDRKSLISRHDDRMGDVFAFGARPAYDQTQFKGKKILVTGGSSGIGYGTALTLARFGADVVICSRDSNPKWFTGAAACDRINNDDTVKENEGHCRWFMADVANRRNITNLFNLLEQDGFLIEYAVNNAGIVGAVGTLKQQAQYFNTEHDAVSNNLQGTVNCLELEFAHFNKHAINGSIVNLASVNGYRPSGGAPLYATSKFGILGLTRNVGTEYAHTNPTIRVNAIAPGYTNTSLVWQQVKLIAGTAEQVWEEPYITPDSELWQKYSHFIIDTIPGKRIADPLDQANMIAFLLSKEASLITGNIFVVDGLDGEN